MYLPIVTICLIPACWKAGKTGNWLRQNLAEDQQFRKNIRSPGRRKEPECGRGTGHQGLGVYSSSPEVEVPYQGKGGRLGEHSQRRHSIAGSKT